ncbi:putative ribonuclease H-like domain-containing protein [Tanacetum coccineum]
MNENELHDMHMNESEVFESASDSSVNESEEDNNQVNDRPDLSFAGLDDSFFKSVVSETVTSVHESKISASKTNKESMEKPKTVRFSAPIIEDWESDSDDDCVIRPSFEQNKPSYAKINFVKSDENTRKSVIEQHTYRQAKNHRKTAVSNSTAKYVNTAATRPTVNDAKPSSNVFHKSHSSFKRTFNQRTAPKNSDFKEKVNTAKVNNVTIAGPKVVVSDVQGHKANAVKFSACWIWRPTGTVIDHISKDSGSYMLERFDYVDPQGRLKCDNGTEFKNTKMNQFCQMKGIKREISVASTPQQNGVAERKNRTLIEAARTMLADSLLPTTFWAEAINTTCYIKNFGRGPEWLFDIDSLTKSMNYEPFTAGNQTNGDACIEKNVNAGQAGQEKESDHEYILLPFMPSNSPLSSSTQISDDKDADEVPGKGDECVNKVSRSNDQERTDSSTQDINNVGPSINTPSTNINTAHDDEDVGVEADLNNLETTMNVSPIHTIRIHRVHPKEQIIGDLNLATQTRRMINYYKEHAKVYFVCNLPGFEDPQFIDKVYKVEKALYGLHQAPRAWCMLMISSLGLQRSLMVESSSRLMKRDSNEVVGDLTFFLGLQVQQKEDGIFISQDKYMADILKKFDFVTVKTSSTPIETNKALIKDEEAKDMDIHLYISMTGSLMYLIASRPDIMFAVCACARFQAYLKVSPSSCIMKRSLDYLKGQPKLGLWYPRDSPFDLEAFSNSDYARASLDRKSIIGGCQLLSKRLISWQCKKQTIVANSTTEAEYVAAANCCGQVLWIPNQMLDYGFNFMNTKLYIDNESTISIVKNPVFHSKTKHIEIRHYFIRDSYEKKLIQVINIHIDHNVADLLTKAFDKENGNKAEVLCDGLRRTQYPQHTSTYAHISNEKPITVLSSSQLKKTYKPRKAKRTTKISQSSGPIYLVADKTVYKEWEDRMERAATTASSLEAEQDNGNINRTQSMATLNEPFPKGTGSGSGPRFQDGKVKLVFEASIRRHLKLEDSDGITTLPNIEIFEQLALMGIPTRQETKVPQPSSPTHTNVTDKAASICMDVRHRGAAITVFSLDAGHGSVNINKTPSMPHDSPLPGGHTPRSDEGKDVEDTSKQGRSIIEDIDQDAGVTLVQINAEDQGRFEDENDTQVLADASRIHTYTRRRRAVSTGSGKLSTASRLISTAEELVSTIGASMLVSTAGMVQESIPSPRATKDKGKAIMTESEPEQTTTKLKQRQERDGYEAAIRLQEQLDEEENQRIARDAEVAQKLQEEIDAAERQRMAQLHQAAQGFIDVEWDDVLARVATDEDFVQQLQAGEKCSEEDLPMNLVELVNKRKKFFAQQRAEAKRNKPMTPAQQKEYMSNYIKNQEGGYSIKQLKSLSFEQVKEIFKTTMRSTIFVLWNSELEVQRLKRAGQEVLEEPIKRQKIREAQFKIFVEMLKKFNRDDLVKLWDLVKERFNTTEPTDDKEKEMCVELKRLFEPDNDDTLWKLQRYMHDPLVWRLYDTCGVHHVSSVRGHEIFMLVEKEYPLTRGLMTVILANKL